MFNLIPFGHGRSLVDKENIDSFDSVVSNFFNDVMGLADFGFKTDIKETDKEFIIEAELPGMKKEDISIELDKGTLIISASKENVEEGKNYIIRERRSGTCQRSFALDNVKEDEIAAEYKDGILTLTLPKKTPGKDKRRTIDIN